MELFYAPLFSGSSGNSVLVGCEDTMVLVDAGLPGSRIEAALKSIHVDPSDLSAILVTHEHVDHIRGVGVLSRKYNLPIYATEGTWSAMEDKIGRINPAHQRIFDVEATFSLGGMDVLAFPTPHDAAESCGYAFERRGARFTLATDIGYVRDGWLKYALGANAVLLESNYDPDMLAAGPYPFDLKRRIASRHGHLSNDDAAAAAVKLVKSGVRQIILGHLSKENNFPELALRTTELVLQQAQIEVGGDVDLRTAQRDAPTGAFELGAEFD